MNEQDMQHGMAYNGQNIDGWVATEKLDGVRAYWDGATMWTRGGNVIAIPAAWQDTLPHGVALDGELFAGYGQRQKAVNAARYGRFYDSVRFVAFDAPNISGNYVERLKYANNVWGYIAGWFPIHYAMKYYVISHMNHANALLRNIKQIGGEGIMLRHPGIEYNPGRTNLMLKLK